MESFVIDGVEINCRVSGGGRPIVLLHGFGGQQSDWSQIESSLKKSRTVIVPNLSRVYLNIGDFRGNVNLIEILLRKLFFRFGSMDLAGVSYGGAMAWALRSRCPEVIGKVMLVNPMPPKPVLRMVSQSLRDLVFFARIPFFLGAYLRSPFGKKALLTLAGSIRLDLGERLKGFHLLLSRRQKLVLMLLTRFSRILTREDWDYWECQLNGQGPETVLIVSQNDPLFGMNYARWLQERLGNCQLVVMEKGSHMAIRTNAGEIWETLEKFLNGERSAAAAGF